MFQWVPFLTYAFITAGTPGPNNIMSMSNGNQRGFYKALPFNFGVLAGVSVIMSLCAIFCSLLSRYIPVIKTPMLYLGAFYILYLAWTIYKSSPEMGGKGAPSGFLSGVLLQLVNVKVYIYGIVSMEAYILPYYSSREFALFGFALLLAFIGFTSTLLWSAFGSVFRLVFSKHGKIVNSIMALGLVYCAVALFN